MILKFIALTIWIIVIAAAVFITFEKYLARQAHNILGEYEVQDPPSHRG